MIPAGSPPGQVGPVPLRPDGVRVPEHIVHAINNISNSDTAPGQESRLYYACKDALAIAYNPRIKVSCLKSCTPTIPQVYCAVVTWYGATQWFRNTVVITLYKCSSSKVDQESAIVTFLLCLTMKRKGKEL